MNYIFRIMLIKVLARALRNHNFLVFLSYQLGNVASLRKLTVLLIVASLVCIIFAVHLHFSYQNRIRETYLSFPEQMRPYMDFAPFSGSREGTLAIVVGALLGMVWVLHLSRRRGLLEG